jgi:hypothetical protein
VTSVQTATSERITTSSPADSGATGVVVRRRTIDAVLIAAGALVAAVLVIAGSLLTWGSNFANDYVHKELTSQNIFFPDRAALETEGRDDLFGFAGQQVTNGNQAEAYASYIAHHLTEVAGGATYADLGAPERAAKAAVTTAKDNGQSESAIADLQAKADEITNQRNTLFKGETLRGLLLSTFAWSTIGRIAGIAATAAFVAAAAMIVLVVLGVWHRRHVTATTT